MPGRSLSKKSSFLEKWRELVLIGFIAFMSAQFVTISGSRYFNFDEFQVLYESAAQLRGKALYADAIGIHFPFLNIIMSTLIAISGFKSTTFLVARYFVLMVTGLTVFYIYRIAEVLWDRRTGLLSVALTLSSFSFLNRGIEIRHDVFNTLFVVMGGYFGLRYTRENKYSYLVISALCFGWALASTQKAIIWIGGTISGIMLCLLRRGQYRDLLKSALIYVVLGVTPLIFCLSYLVLIHDESLRDFLRVTVFNVAEAVTSPPKSLFPHDRFVVIGNLLYQNALLYALGCGGVVAGIIEWWRNRSEKILLATCALFGTLFFLTARRPFYQSFLPTIPLLAIMASGMLHTIWGEFKGQDLSKLGGLGVVCLLLLFVWPVLVITHQKSKDLPMTSQLDNVSFCLASLKGDERVLSFTKNQVFFDSVLESHNEVCGRNFYDYDADCFEEKMIKAQCKVVINDYRTKLLNQEIQAKIAANYVPTKFGDILIPGFKLPAGAAVNKKVWIKGDYYSPTRSVEVEGKKVDGDLIHLDQKEYSLKNNSRKSVYLVYVFDKGRFIEQEKK